MAYNCKCTSQVYLLATSNVLYVEHMENNLIPQFILQEVGLEVNGVPKIHCTRDGKPPHDHTIQDVESSLFILLYIYDIFSVFHTQKPFEEDP